ncbi:MAG: discoidin domain-containing protein [Bacteroidales bacterium]
MKTYIKHSKMCGMIISFMFVYFSAHAQHSVSVYSVSKDHPTLRQVSDLSFETITPEKNLSPNIIRVFSGDKKQTLMGMGGAITQSSAYLLKKLPKEKRDEILEAYYGKSGCRYSMMRTHIGSCDFSLRNYSYDETPNDFALNDFSIAEDQKYILPAIKQAFKLNPNIKLFTAPWSPPSWMKKSGDRYAKGLGSISYRDNSLREDCYDVYARYLAKYVQEFKKNGIDVFSVSVQNEMQNNPPWEGTTYSIGQTINFVGKHLGPTFEKEGIKSKIIIWDWDKQNDVVHGDGMDKFCFNVLKDPVAGKYIWGVGYHWYGFDLGTTIAKDDVWSLVEFPYIDYVKNRFPNKHFIATEQAAGGFIDIKTHPWTPAARLIFDVVNDFAHNTEGWMDWNILLTSKGGPNHTSPDTTMSGCVAPIVLDPDTKEIIYTPAFYAMKLFSRNIRPGARVVNSEYNTWNNNCFCYLNQVSVQNPDGSITVFISNSLDEYFKVDILDGDKVVTYTLEPNSLTAFTYSDTANERDDLAESKYAYASASENGYNPSHAEDNDLNSRWASDWKDDQWLEINLQEPQTVNSISSLWQNGSSNDYIVEYKTDNGNWKEVSYLNRYKSDSKLDIDGPWPFFKRYYDVKASEVKFRSVPLRIDFFEPVHTTSIRIHGVKRHEKYGYSIYQVKVSGPESPELAYKNDFTISSSSNQSDYYANLVMDGISSDRWSSDWNDNQNITFDAGKKCYFSDISMKFENARDCEFKIQVSDDNQSFRDVPYTLERFYEYTHVKFKPNEAVGRYIRFQGIKRNSRYGYSMYNVSISGHFDSQKKSSSIKTSNNRISENSNMLEVYPNPITNHQFRITSKYNNCTGYLYDVNGKAMKNILLNKGVNDFSLNLNPGVYIFKLPSHNETRKIIIE